jgi:hypothetical protein
MITIINFENAFGLLDRRITPACKHLPQPSTQKVLELLVRCFLCPSSMDDSCSALCLFTLKENYGSDFIYSHWATMVTEEIKYKIEAAFPALCLGVGNVGIPWGSVKFHHQCVAHIRLNDEQYRKATCMYKP